MSDSEKNDIGEKFSRYAFADTVTIGGSFSSLIPKKKELVRNSNFNFGSDDSENCISIDSIDGMFNGCVNAVFSNPLVIGSNSSVQSAKMAFKDCFNAKLPIVDIANSHLSNTESMFENCYNAELSGVTIPSESESFSGMFKNCSIALLDDLDGVPNDGRCYSELFYGCTNASLRNFSFHQTGLGLLCDYMFWGCESLDSEHLSFDVVSKNIVDGRCMFYGSGEKSSKIFNNVFSRFYVMENCDNMFSGSNYEFDNCYFQFYGYNEFPNSTRTSVNVRSVRRMFADTHYVKDCAPTIVLGSSINDESPDFRIEDDLDYSRNGHYQTTLQYGIMDFTELYKGSSCRSADIRGITYNKVINSIGLDHGVQNFTGMFAGCTNLKSLRGCLPNGAFTYDTMFSGCSSLEIDLPKLFKKQPNISWTTESELENAYYKDSMFESYHVTSIAGMFDSSEKLYSSDDLFDLVGFVKNVDNNLKTHTSYTTEIIKSSFDSAFSDITIATNSPVPGLELVDYGINAISKSTGIIRYNSYEPEPYEISAKNDKSEYGIYSEYMRYMFKRGFYRYGGKFKDDGFKYFCVMYYPNINESTGDVIEFTNEILNGNKLVYPNGWGNKFNIDKSKGYWNEFEFDTLYAAAIYSDDGTFIKNAYVGPYTRIFHEMRMIDGEVKDCVSKIAMPVTYFDGAEEEIRSL